MKFSIEQIALFPANSTRAKQLLAELGIEKWAEDTVVAKGRVFGQEGTNSANLSFNYDVLSGKEFEVLDYTAGENWMTKNGRSENSVSHLGMHVTDDELKEWRKFFSERGIGIAQEVFTQSHTNPVISGKRSYEYVIFDTKDILGVDLKFIRRINLCIVVECLVCQSQHEIGKEFFHGQAQCAQCCEMTNHIEVKHQA